MAEVVWYYAKNDRQLGPVAPNELRRLATAGELLPSDLIWREGMEGWAPAAKVKGLFSELATTPPQMGDPTAPPAIGFGAAEAAPQITTEPFITGSEVRSAGEVRPLGGAPDLLWTSQMILWSVCVAIALVGGILFARSILRAETAGEEVAAGAIYSTFLIGAYVVARAGERVAALIQAHFNRSAKS